MTANRSFDVEIPYGRWSTPFAKRAAGSAARGEAGVNSAAASTSCNSTVTWGGGVPVHPDKLGHPSGLADERNYLKLFFLTRYLPDWLKWSKHGTERLR